MSRSIIWSAGAKRLLYCFVSALMFTWTLRFGTYQTILLDPQQLSIKKIAPLLFHSTSLTTDGSRLFSSSCPRKISPGDEVSIAIKQEPLTIFFWKKSIPCVIRIFGLKNGRQKTVVLLSVGSNVHRDTKTWFLSNDRFRSSRIFNRNDSCFVVSFNYFDGRWKQIVYQVVVRKRLYQDMNFR